LVTTLGTVLMIMTVVSFLLLWFFILPLILKYCVFRHRIVPSLLLFLVRVDACWCCSSTIIIIPSTTTTISPFTSRSMIIIVTTTTTTSPFTSNSTIEINMLFPSFLTLQYYLLLIYQPPLMTLVLHLPLLFPSVPKLLDSCTSPTNPLTLHPFYCCWWWCRFFAVFFVLTSHVNVCSMELILCYVPIYVCRGCIECVFLYSYHHHYFVMFLHFIYYSQLSSLLLLKMICQFMVAVSNAADGSGTPSSSSTVALCISVPRFVDMRFMWWWTWFLDVVDVKFVLIIAMIKNNWLTNMLMLKETVYLYLW